MGWDAFVERPDGTTAMLHDDDGFLPHPAFLVEVEKIRAKGLSVDGLLKFGGLDVSTCAQMLKRATKLDPWTPLWTAETVKAAAAKAKWTFRVSPDEEWARESARAFLETAAKLGLAIRFSW